MGPRSRTVLSRPSPPPGKPARAGPGRGLSRGLAGPTRRCDLSASRPGRAPGPPAFPHGWEETHRGVRGSRESLGSSSSISQFQLIPPPFVSRALREAGALNRSAPTGAPGGCVAQALLEDGIFKVHAVTWSPVKKEAEELKQRGAEVVKVDQDDEPSLELALAGAYGAFVVTNFWEHCSKEKEITLVSVLTLTGTTCRMAWERGIEGQLCGIGGKRLADLSKCLGLHHVVYSSLENTKQLTGDRLEVLHFDGKGVAEEYFQKRLGAKNSSCTSSELGGTLTRINLSCTALPMGDTPMDGMAVEDIGPVVLCLLKSPEDYIDKVIRLGTVLSQQPGKTVEASKVGSIPWWKGPSGLCPVTTLFSPQFFLQMSPEQYEEHGSPGAKEMAATFRFYALKPDRNVDLTVKLNPKAHTFPQWVADKKAAF
ncbi:hypothetical protein QYF61_025266 [Mycteria americana]|uniref:NmrA-like family domain-containing protein 1 n=1 Tax=Mycteria americana TaxID=33587 RepID=A0AAN7NLC3_MYCAM|nr:hypothetical protein QYF61_025266 [Mycteria americana]